MPMLAAYNLISAQNLPPLLQNGLRDVEGLPRPKPEPVASQKCKIKRLVWGLAADGDIPVCEVAAAACRAIPVSSLQLDVLQQHNVLDLHTQRQQCLWG